MSGGGILAPRLTGLIMQTKCVVTLRALIAAVIVIAGATSLSAQTTIANVALTSGWATFGQAVPQGVATAALTIGSLSTQTDVKSRWPDGSIKFAIVTVKVPSADSYAITASARPTGTFAPLLPTASVRLTIAGVTYTAVLPGSPVSFDTWMSGPLVFEGRAVVVGRAGSDHPFLRVNFDTRVYSDGKGRVDVSVENILDKLGATTVTYDVTITVNGQNVFTQAAVQHYYLTRWRKVFPIAGTVLSSITPDIRPFNVARILPPYLSLVDNQVSVPSGLEFGILQPGALDPNMPAHGGRPELAPYPDWTARYLVHRDQTQRSFVLANGDLSGSWPIHLREAENSSTLGVGNERFVSLDQRPTLWYDSRANPDFDSVKGSPMPIREYGSLDPGPGQSPLIPDDAHQPSLAYVPYLLTGDRYYAEEMAFWANYGMIRTYPGDGVRGGQGILAYNEVRGIGWALRNLAEAAALYPEGAVKDYLVAKTTSNLQWLDTFANAQNPTTNPFKVMWIGKRPDGNQYISLWEQTYLAYGIDRALKLGFAPGQAHRDAIAKFQLRLFTSDPQYPKAQGAPYIVAVGTPPATGGVFYDSYATFGFFTSMAQIWTGTNSPDNNRDFAGYYGPEARLNLMIGIDSGWTGAQAAYDYLWPFIGVTAFWGPLPDLAQRAGWALDFYSATPAKLPPRAPRNLRIVR
jgi:hypothetical protein